MNTSKKTGDTMTPKEKLKLLAEYEETIKKQAELTAKILPLKAKENYATYVEYVHMYDKEFHIARFQKYICGCIDKLINGELLNEDGTPYEGICLSMPTQHGKSRCVTETLPSYFLGKFPYRHVIEVSYGDDFANKFGRRNVEKIEEFGKTLFDIEISKDKSSAEEFEIAKTRGGMISRGLSGAINGNPADLVIVDDPYKNYIEADSLSHKQKIMDIWTSALKTRVSAKCKFVIVHTRWNNDDLIGYLLETEPKQWFEINFALIAEEDEPITGRKIGDALLPEAGKDNKWAAKYKESFLSDPMGGGLRVWNALMQGKPTSLEGNMIKRDYWKRFTLTLEMQKSGYFPVKIQSWDCALKDTADPVAGQVWGKRGANYYMVDHIGGRMDIVETMEGITKLSAKHPDGMAKLIEDKANGPAAMRILRDRISGLIPVNPGTKSKAERVSMVLPLWVAGNVYIPDRIETSPGIYEPCLWANDIIEQCAAFKPDKKVQRDDEVDSSSQALNWLYFQTADLPEPLEPDDFWDRNKNESSYFGSVPDEDYFRSY
jgi:predicted phage terminase large subunit-like protein